MFGTEDRLLHKLAGVQYLFTSNWLQERFWPVHSLDVSHALELMLYDESSVGSTYELYGPKEYSMAEIAQLVDNEIVKKRRRLNLPKSVLKPLANVLNKALWWHTIAPDEVEMEFLDQKIDPTAKTFKDLGIEPADIQRWTYHYLTMYRSSQYYDLPPSTEREKSEDKKYYHVVDNQLIPKADRKLIHEYLFREGVLVAKKDFNLPKHPEIDTKNLY
ncbi:39kDa subunit of ndufa9, NADH:ubiquinone oxidoreductase, partial [Ascosphaera atra]